MKTWIIVLLLASPCLASDRLLPESGIRVTQGIVVAELPKHMKPAEFYHWAIAQNKASLERSRREHQEGRERNGDRTVRGKYEEDSSTTSNRLGGGVGYNGFGGEGGYAGYSNQWQPINNGFSYGFGFTNPGNATQGTVTNTARAYEKVWYDNTYYGSPVHVINPFCLPEE